MKDNTDNQGTADKRKRDRFKAVRQVCDVLSGRRSLIIKTESLDYLRDIRFGRIEKRTDTIMVSFQ